MSIDPAGWLKALVRPTSYGVAGRRALPSHAIVARDCRRVSAGRVDLAVLNSSPSRLSSELTAVARRARAVVIIEPQRLPPRASPLPDLPLLGPGGALWTPRLRVGIGFAEGNTDPHRRPCVIFAQGPAVAQHLAALAAAQGLPLEAVFAVGELPEARLARLAMSAASLESRPRLLFAFHRPVSAQLLHALAEAVPGAPIWLPAALGGLSLPAGAGVPPTPAVARALGLLSVSAPEELVEVAVLLDQGFAPGRSQLIAVASSADEAAILEEACTTAGFSITRAQPRRTRSLVELVLSTSECLPPSRPRPAERCWQLFGPATSARVAAGRTCSLIFTPAPPAGGAGHASRATLAGMAALLNAPNASDCEPGTPPRRDLRRAHQLLDRSGVQLHELEVKRLLACYNLRSPAEGLATSASGAELVARRVGLPVVVKAVGPTLRERAALGAIRLAVPSLAACRQAFRDVIQACSLLQPPPALEGVLVSTQVDLPSALHCTMIWPEALPPLLIVGISGRGDSHVLPTPLSMPRALSAARGLAARARWPGGHALEALAHFLRGLSWLGPDLRDRLCWLRLDTVSLPTDTGPALVIDGAAEQREGLRAPWS